MTYSKFAERFILNKFKSTCRISRLIKI